MSERENFFGFHETVKAESLGKYSHEYSAGIPERRACVYRKNT